MSLYCSAKIPEDNPFHKKFITFCSESKFANWNGISFGSVLRNRSIFDGAIGGTRIDLALKLILDSALNWNLTQDQLPTTLLIVSDMQFHQGVTRHSELPVERMLNEFIKNGYTPPKVVYWNTNGYVGQPATVDGNNIGLVSGFSPSILKAIFSGDDFNPISIMLRALEKYEIIIP